MRAISAVEDILKGCGRSRDVDRPWSRRIREPQRLGRCRNDLWLDSHNVNTTVFDFFEVDGNSRDGTFSQVLPPSSAREQFTDRVFLARLLTFDFSRVNLSFGSGSEKALPHDTKDPA